MAKSTADLRDLVKGITGFDIMESETEFKSIYDIVVGIGEVWDQINDVDQAALLQKLAGKAQGNALAAALESPDLIKQAYTIAEGSEGSAMREQEIWEQSIDARIAKMKASIESLSSDILDSDLFGNLIDGATQLLNLVDQLINSFGALGTAMGVGGLGLFIKNIPSFEKMGKDIITSKALETTIVSSAGKNLGLDSFIKSDLLSMSHENIGGIFGPVFESLAKSSNGAESPLEDAAKFLLGKGLDSDSTKNILADSFGKAADDAGKLLYTTTQIEDAMSNAEKAVEATGTAAVASSGKLGAAISAITKSILIWAPAIAGVAALIGAISVAKYYEADYDRKSKAFSEKKSDYEETLGQIEDYNSKISELDSSIEQINSKEKLTFTDKAELENLKAQKEELESLKTIQEDLLNTQKHQASNAAIEALESDKGSIDYSKEYKAPGIYDDKKRYGKSKLLEAQEHNIAELTEAQEKLNKVQEEYNKADKTGKITPELQKRYDDAQNHVTEIKNTLEDGASALEEYKEMLDTSDARGAEKYNQVAKAIRDTSNAMSTAKSPVEQMRRNIDAAFTSTDEKIAKSRGDLKEYLTDAVNNGQTASEALASIGLSVQDIDLADIADGSGGVVSAVSSLNQYFDDLKKSADDAKKAEEAALAVRSQVDGSFEGVKAAQESENAGANWESMAGWFKTAKELYDKDLVGTDDFQTIAQFMSPKQINTKGFEYASDAYVKAWKKSYDKFKRYFDTENPTDSMVHFIDDAASDAHKLMKDNGDGSYTNLFKTTAEAAEEMGLSVQATETILNRLKDYGWEFDGIEWSSQKLDDFRGELEQVQELYQNMEEGPNKDRIGQLLVGWNSQYEYYQDNLSELDQDAIVHIKFEYDLASVLQDIEELDNQLISGWDHQTAGQVISKRIKARELLEEQTGIDENDKEYAKSYSVIDKLSNEIRNTRNEDLKEQRQQTLDALLEFQVQYQQSLANGETADWSTFVLGNLDEVLADIPGISDEALKEARKLLLKDAKEEGGKVKSDYTRNPLLMDDSWDKEKSWRKNSQYYKEHKDEWSPEQKKVFQNAFQKEYGGGVNKNKNLVTDVKASNKKIDEQNKKLLQQFEDNSKAGKDVGKVYKDLQKAADEQGISVTQLAEDLKFSTKGLEKYESKLKDSKDATEELTDKTGKFSPKKLANKIEKLGENEGFEFKSRVDGKESKVHVRKDETGKVTYSTKDEEGRSRTVRPVKDETGTITYTIKETPEMLKDLQGITNPDGTVTYEAKVGEEMTEIQEVMENGEVVLKAQDKNGELQTIKQLQDGSFEWDLTPKDAGGIDSFHEVAEANGKHFEYYIDFKVGNVPEALKKLFPDLSSSDGEQGQKTNNKQKEPTKEEVENTSNTADALSRGEIPTVPNKPKQKTGLIDRIKNLWKYLNSKESGDDFFNGLNQSLEFLNLSENDLKNGKADVHIPIESFVSRILGNIDVENQLRELSQGGNVDLLNRPLINTSQLWRAGWRDVESGGKATVYSSTYSNPEGTEARNFTPIVADREGNLQRVLSPDELRSYAEGVISGIRTDNYGLQIGDKYTGKDAIEKAESDAEKIHGLHEQYYLNGDDFYKNGKTDVHQALPDALENTKKALDGLFNVLGLGKKTTDSYVQSTDKASDSTKKLSNSEKEASRSAKKASSDIKSAVNNLKSGESTTYKANVDNTETKVTASKDGEGVIHYTADIGGIEQEVQPILNQDGTISYTTKGLPEVEGDIEKVTNADGTVSYKADIGGVEQEIKPYLDENGEIKYKAVDVDGVEKEVEAITDGNHIVNFEFKQNGEKDVDKPGDVTAGISYTLKSQDEPEAKTTDVNYRKGKQDPPSNKTATVTYVANTSKLPTTFSSLHRTVYYEKKPKLHGSTGLVSGTAAMHGTARASGSPNWLSGLPESYKNQPISTDNYPNKWQTKSSENALTGEVGPEMVVNGNKWWIVGQKGPEFAHIPAHSIVFNSKQTDDLLKNGATSSRGEANLEGSAYSKGSKKESASTIKKKYNQLLKKKKERKKKMMGNVDLNHRPIVLTGNGDYHTVLTTTFLYSDFSKNGLKIKPVHKKDKAFNVTPIYPNGKWIRTESSLFDTIYNYIKEGGKLNKSPLYMGSYKSLAAAEKAAIEAHNGQAKLYDKEAKYKRLYQNLKKSNIFGSAYANGSLVGELGPEMIVSGDRWWLAGENGPEFTHIPANSVVFNHKQTEDLLNKGQTNTRGKANLTGSFDEDEDDFEALIGGTAFGNGGRKPGSSSSSSSSSSSTKSKSSGDGGSKKKKKKKSSDDKKDKTWEKFEKWLSSLFDWVEVKLTHLKDVTEKWSTAAQKAVNQGSQQQANFYKEAIKALGKEIDANRKSEKGYKKEAQLVGKKGVEAYNKKAKDKDKIDNKNNKWVNSIIKDLENGRLKVDDKGNFTKQGKKDVIAKYGEKRMTLVKDIQTWYNKSQQSAKAVRDLTDNLQELYNSLKDIPNVKADKAVEKITKELEILKGTTELFKYNKAGSETRQNNGYISSMFESLNSQTSKTKSQLNERAAAKKETEADLKNSGNALKTAKNKNSKKLSKKANSTIDKALKSKTKIEIKDGWPTSVKKAAASWNASLDANEKAVDNYDTMYNTYWQTFYENEAQKLEAITEWFGALEDKYSSRFSELESNVELWKTQGRYLEGNYAIFAQEEESKKQSVDNARNQRVAYQEELKTQLANGSLAVGSLEYQKAITELQNLRAAENNAVKEFEEFKKSLYDLDFSNLENALDRIQNKISRLSSKADYYETVGNKKNAPYSDEEILESYSQVIQENLNAMAVAMEEFNMALKKQEEYEIDSEEWKEQNDHVKAAREEIVKLATDIENVSDKIREIRWKPFEQFTHSLERVETELSNIQELLNEDNFLDKKGILTEDGIANLAIFNELMQNSFKLTESYRGALEKLEEEYENNIITQDELNDKSEEYIDLISEEAKKVADYRDKIVEQYINSLEIQNDLLQEHIELQKDALQKLRDYHDYERNISKQSKNASYIELQVRALNGVNNKAAKAKLADLQNQLAEVREELNETVYQHQIELRQLGYDKLAQDANDSFERTTDNLKRNIALQDEAINLMLNNAVGNYTIAYGKINEVINDNGLVVTTATGEVIDTIGEIGKKLDEVAGTTNIDTVAIVTQIRNQESALKDLDKQYEGIIEDLNEIAKRYGTDTGTILQDIADHKDNIEELEGKYNGITEALATIASKYGTDTKTIVEAIGTQSTNVETLGGKYTEIVSALGGYYDNLTNIGTKYGEVTKDAETYLAVLQKIAGIKTDNPIDNGDGSGSKNPGELVKENLNINDTEVGQPEGSKANESVGNGEKEVIPIPANNNNKQPAPTTTTTTKKAQKTVTQSQISRAFQIIITNLKWAKEQNKSWAQLNKDLWHKENPARKIMIPEDAERAAYSALGSPEGSYSAAHLQAALKKTGLWNHLLNFRTKDGKIVPPKNIPSFKSYSYYAKGSSYIKKNQLGWTQEEGQELVYRRSDGAVLTPLGKGDKVFTADMTDNLWKLAKGISTDSLNRNVSNINQTTINNKPSINVSFDSLIHVEGSIDKDATEEMRRIAQESVNRFSRKLSDDFGMLGHKLRV